MLKDKIRSNLTAALKAGDKARVETLRFLLSEINIFEINNYPPASTLKLTDTDCIKVIRKQVKNHEESIAAFSKGGRQDLVDKETAELEILKTYLPHDLPDDEIEKIVAGVVKSGAANFGQAMGVVMKQVAGRTSGERVVELVKKALQEA